MVPLTCVPTSTTSTGSSVPVALTEVTTAPRVTGARARDGAAALALELK